MSVVESQTLPANQTVSRAECRPRVAVRQGRGQKTMGAFEAVPAEEVIVLRKVVVNLYVELVVFASQHWVEEKIIDGLPVRRPRPGDVRHGVELINDGLRRRVELTIRNHIAGEGLARQGIVNCAVQLGEIAAAHLQTRHGRKKRLAVANSPALIIAEEKHLVAADSPAECAAELVLPVRRFGAPIFVIEKVVGVERVVAQEFEGAAVKIVLARFDLDIDHTAAGPTELGRVGAGLYFELFERVFRSASSAELKSQQSHFGDELFRCRAQRSG